MMTDVNVDERTSEERPGNEVLEELDITVESSTIPEEQQGDITKVKSERNPQNDKVQDAPVIPNDDDRGLKDNISNDELSSSPATTITSDHTPGDISSTTNIGGSVKKMGSEVLKRASATVKATGEALHKAAETAKHSLESSTETTSTSHSKEIKQGELGNESHEEDVENTNSKPDNSTRVGSMWNRAKRLSGSAVSATKNMASRTASTAASTISQSAAVVKQKTMGASKRTDDKSCDKDISKMESNDQKQEESLGNQGNDQAVENVHKAKNEGESKSEESMVTKIRRASVTAFNATEPVVVSTVSTVGATIKETASSVYMKAAPAVLSAWKSTKEGTTLAIEKTKEAMNKRRSMSVEGGEAIDEIVSEENSVTVEISGSVQEGSVYSGDGESALGDNEVESEQRMKDVKADVENLTVDEENGENDSMGNKGNIAETLADSNDMTSCDDVHHDDNDEKNVMHDMHREVSDQGFDKKEIKILEYDDKNGLSQSDIDEHDSGNNEDNVRQDLSHEVDNQGDDGKGIKN